MPKTRAQIAAEIAANLPDNSSGSITPTLVRDTMTDIAAAAPNIADDAALLSAILAKTANYTLATTDNGKVITLGNGPFTLSLGDIATYSAVFSVLLIHQGNDKITVQAFGSQTIINAEYGAENTKLMYQGESGFLTKIGTLWGFTKTNQAQVGEGLMSEIVTGKTRISVVPAATDSLGGVIVGSGLDVDSEGVVSVTPTITPLGFGFDGGGSVLETGIAFKRVVSVAGTIVGWRIVADVSGSITLVVKKGTPSGSTVTLSSIVASAPPALSSQQVVSSTTLTGWTTSLAVGDVVEVSITGTPATITSVAFSLDVTLSQ